MLILSRVECCSSFKYTCARFIAIVTHAFNDGSVILGQFSSKSLCVPSYMPLFGEKDKDKADMGCFEFHTDSPQEWIVEVN